MSMSTPSRREFFTYVAAATLASALPACQTKTGQTKKDTTLLPPKDPAVLPLVVDVIGPMVFRWTGGKFELWMPDLSKEDKKKGITPHEAGIMTTVTSIELGRGDYRIDGPSSSPGTPPIYSPRDGRVYQAHVQEIQASNKYIHMSLPNPHCVAVLNPVLATIYPQKTSGRYAVGVRLFYEQANKPVVGSSMLKETCVIPLYASPCDTQTNMLIGYVPYDFRDDSHEHAKASFHEVSLLCGLDLQVEFDPDALLTSCPPLQTGAPLRDCKSPAIVIGLGG